jgi:hypothetical protein
MRNVKRPPNIYNYLAIEALEQLGMDAPSQTQIDAMEETVRFLLRQRSATQAKRALILRRAA